MGATAEVLGDEAHGGNHGCGGDGCGGDDGDGMATMRATGKGGTKGILLWRGKASWGKRGFGFWGHSRIRSGRSLDS